MTKRSLRDACWELIEEFGGEFTYDHVTGVVTVTIPPR